MKNMLNDKPDAYKKGWTEFYKLRFKVTSDVLIPRPETELLVDEVLSFIRLNLNQGLTLTHLTVLDLGTGSGNIAISCAKYIPTSDVGIRIIATDISEKALRVARQNARLHGVEEKITFIQSNLLDVIARSDSNDNLIIVTNLPYIPSARIPYLDSSVKDFEPHLALDGGKDGFDLYRRLFKQIKKKGWLAHRSLGVGGKPKSIIGEIDYTHGELAINEAQKYFPDAQIEVKKDLTHLQRILIIKF